MFGFVMVLLMFWGINFLKGKNVFTRSHTFYTTFKDVDGLKVSGDVMFRGMKVGTITDIIFNPSDPDKIVVEFTVPKKYPVPNDSKVTTHNTMIVTGKVMIIDYGNSSEYYKDGDMIPSLTKPNILEGVSGDFETIKDRANELVNNVSQTLTSINALLSEENIRNISGTLASVNQIAATDLKRTMQNLNSLTHSLNQSTENLDNILVNVEHITDTLRAVDFPQLVANINGTVSELNAVLAKANTGEGNLGQLLNDRELYENLVASTRNLSALLEDLKANPKRYVHFSVFGRKDR